MEKEEERAACPRTLESLFGSLPHSVACKRRYCPRGHYPIKRIVTFPARARTEHASHSAGDTCSAFEMRAFVTLTFLRHLPSNNTNERQCDARKSIHLRANERG